MQEIIAPVSNIRFDIELAIEQQIGSLPLPFPGMDKSGAAICTYYLTSVCSKGAACPYRHVKGDRSVVCKHWLRGLCKKGDDCEFLHEYDMSKMPECYFFSRFDKCWSSGLMDDTPTNEEKICGECLHQTFSGGLNASLSDEMINQGQCSNKDCPFLHIDPENKIKDCPWYDRGFCRHGPLCKNRHVRRVICQCYLNGFCLDGPNCKYVHPSFDIPAPDPQQQAKKLAIVCHTCGLAGHKAAYCPTTGGQHMLQSSQSSMVNEGGFIPEETRSRRPLDQVTCYKCGEKGHYANKCPKGHLAFLSPHVADINIPPPRMASHISTIQ